MTGSSVTPTVSWSSPATRSTRCWPRAVARAEKEVGYFADLRAGATTLELLGLDPGLIDGA